MNKKQLLENKLRRIIREELIKEEDPNYRKKADFKYSDRNSFLIQRTNELYEQKYSREMINLLNEIMDELRNKLSIKDISYGRTATADIKVIRSTLKKLVLAQMQNWTD